VDLVFLDIHMPGMNGFEMLARLPHQSVVIFTTAFDHYALSAFEVIATSFCRQRQKCPVSFNSYEDQLDRCRFPCHRQRLAT
jgi:two-component SAPR family response regulator